MSSAVRGHRLVAHTADVIVEAWGADLAACADELVAGLLATFLDADRADPVSTATITLPPADEADLLLSLVDEIVFLLDTGDTVPVATTTQRRTDGGLDVVVALADAATVEQAGSVPKGISRSGFAVEHDGRWVRCRMLVDV